MGGYTSRSVHLTIQHFSDMSIFFCRGLSESLLLEVLREGKTGIHITDVHPGHTNTDMFAGLTHRYLSLQSVNYSYKSVFAKYL